MGYQMLQVEPQNYKVERHLQLVSKGKYRLPEFQRTFVWDDDRISKLWDSLYHGFPIGQLMLWEPDDINFPMRSLGRRQADVAEAKNDATAVIDGQQRLTALYLVLTGETRLRFDLAKERFTFSEAENCLRLDILQDAAGSPIPWEDVAEKDYFRLHASTSQQSAFGGALNRLNGILRNREIPSQTIKDANYATVLGVFKRLNQQGEPLNEAQLTMAGISRTWPGVFRRTYDLLRRMNEEMGFDQAEDPTFVFQIWSAVHTGQHLVKHLAPEDERSRYHHLVDPTAYEKSWTQTEKGIGELIDIMRTDLDLTNFKFIRAYYPLAVVAHYLATHDAGPKERDALRRWLVLSLVSGRYHERAQSRYGGDIKATTGSKDIADLFSHKDALDPRTVDEVQRYLTTERLLSAGFRSAYTTLLYLLARKLNATDWIETKIPVGAVLPGGTWHYHHIFPDETFDADRGALRDALEEAQAEGDEEKSMRIAQQRENLEARIASIGNLAFLTPATNQTISNRPPMDYLKEIAGTTEGRAALEAQLVPLEPDLWKHSAFEEFLKKRCDLIVAKAKELFFRDVGRDVPVGI